MGVTGAVWSRLRRPRRVLGAGPTSIALIATAMCGAALAAPLCDDVRPAVLEVRVRVEPDAPEVGDFVLLEADIVNTSGGVAAIPLFQLGGAEPWFAIEAQENSYPEVAFVRYWLRAVRAGQTGLALRVNFATSSGCADTPDFVFPSVASRPYPIIVRGEAAIADTPTPTRTALSTPFGGRPTRAQTSAASRRR